MYNKRIVTFYNDKQVVKNKVGYSRSPEKPRLLLEYLKKQGFGEYFDIRSDFEPFTHSDFYEGHTKAYVDAFFKGEQPLCESNSLRWSPEFAESVRYTNASFYEAIRHAVLNAEDITFSPTSGFHHARPNGGGGFCTFSGQVIAARKIWKEMGKRALFLDYDGHFGNSIEDSRAMFPDLNDAVFMNFNPYDFKNPLTSGVGKKIVDGWERNEWDYIVFCHGADSHEWDDIGGGATTTQWLDCAAEVYEMVKFLNDRGARKEKVPLILSLFGGYRQDDYESVLSLHTGSLVQSLELAGIKVPYEPRVKPRVR